MLFSVTVIAFDLSDVVTISLLLKIFCTLKLSQIFIDCV